jgi:Zn-dependent protease with chaperone function
MATQIQGPGTFFDGVSGAARAVTVTLEDDALVITPPEGTPLARWNYSALERLPAPDHRLRLALAKSPSTARLEMRDPAFAEAVKAPLEMRTVQVEARESRKRHRVVEWSIAAVLAVAVVGIVGLPSFAGLLLPFIPPSAEAAMGETLDGVLRANFKEPGAFECGEAGEQERGGKAAFLRMFNRLDVAANLPTALHPVIVRTSVINASAAPGGHVYVNKGIIEYLNSPDELAGIIAHELGHVAYRHSLRGMLHSAGLSYLLGSALGGAFGSGGVILASEPILANRNSRAQETQADAFGMALMRKIGADPHVLANPFERMLSKAEPPSKMLLSYDHPANGARVAAVRASPGVANPQPVLSPQEWEALKQVCSGS